MVNKIEDAFGTISTSSTTTTVVFSSGFGTPVAVEVWIAKIGSSGAWSYGIWDGTNVRGQACGIQDASVNTNTWKARSNAKIGYVVDPSTGSFTRSFTISVGVPADSIAIIASSTSGVAYQYMVRAYGGAGTQAKVISFTGAPAVAGGFRAITGVGFKPDFVKTMGDGTYGSPLSASAGHQWSVGAATRYPTVRNIGVQWFCNDNDVTSDVQLLASASVFSIDTTGANGSNQVASFDDDGVTIYNAIQNNQAPDGAMLLVKMPGYQFWCGAITSPTSTGDKAITEPNFRMLAGNAFGTSVDALDTFKTDSTAESLSISAFSGTPTASYDGLTIQIQDNLTVLQHAETFRESPSKIMVSHTNESGSDPDLQATWVSWDPPGMTANWGGSVLGTSRNQLLFAAGLLTSDVPRQARRTFKRSRL